MEGSVIYGRLPEWAVLVDHITRDDVIRHGACADGVHEFAEMHFPSHTALPARRAAAIGNDHIDRALHLIGSGSGNGSGSGSGDGYGYGYGDGFGYGYGDGNGSGFGSGFGFGDGYED